MFVLWNQLIHEYVTGSWPDSENGLTECFESALSFPTQEEALEFIKKEPELDCQEFPKKEDDEEIIIRVCVVQCKRRRRVVWVPELPVDMYEIGLYRQGRYPRRLRPLARRDDFLTRSLKDRDERRDYTTALMGR